MVSARKSIDPFAIDCSKFELPGRIATGKKPFPEMTDSVFVPTFASSIFVPFASPTACNSAENGVPSFEVNRAKVSNEKFIGPFVHLAAAFNLSIQASGSGRSMKSWKAEKFKLLV